LDAARLSRIPGCEVRIHDELGSTNAEATRLAREGSAPGLVVVAEHQQSGRGRLDRRWEAPPRSALTFSVLWRPPVPVGFWPWLPLLTGYAVRAALLDAGVEAHLKWPNDVLIDERKVAGVLVERVETPSGPAAIIGVGLNVSMTEDELPVPTAGSLALASATVPDRTDLLLGLLAALGSAYDDWVAEAEAGSPSLRAAYRAACSTIGRTVRADLPDGHLIGLATGVDAEGRLVLATATGSHTIGAGDVVHIRPHE
jgi:BirA family transcriptional regulator, biotin operon repressor / biotin---[acetyl-CoA-carboxylase] ligase